MGFVLLVSVLLGGAIINNENAPSKVESFDDIKSSVVSAIENSTPDYSNVND